MSVALHASQAFKELLPPRTLGNYAVGAEIGRGSFANVYKGLDTTSGRPVAIKAVFRSRLKSKKLMENLEVEILILKNLQNPHVVRLIDCLKTLAHFHLVMEYCSLGDLLYLIRKRSQLARTHPLFALILERYPLPAESHGLHRTLVVHFVQQLALALEFLRAQNLVHRDIKPQNLLLSPPCHTREAAQELGYVGLWELPVLKIADFGFARFLPSTSLAETLCGLPLYMAPEILRYEKYNAKADLWSVGAVVYEMAVGKPPFRAANHVELLKKIERANDHILFPHAMDLDDDVVRLVCGLLKFNPTERMLFAEFFAHPVVVYDLGADSEDVPLERSGSMDENLFISEYILPLGRSAGTAVAGASRQPIQGQAPLVAVPESASPEPVALYSEPDSPVDPKHDEKIKMLINDNLPGPETVEHSIIRLHQGLLATAGGGAASRRPGESGSDIVIEKDYVVVEKRAVEVNALADELAHAGSGAGAIGDNSSSRRPTHLQTNPYDTGLALAPVAVVRRPSLLGRVLPLHAERERRLLLPRAGTTGVPPARRRLLFNHPINISINATNALAKALGLASNRLFGVKVDSGQVGVNVSPPLFAARPLQLEGSVVSEPLLDLPLPEDEQTVVVRLESLATKAHAVLLFAEVKFSQLVPLQDDGAEPLPPAMVKTVAEEGGVLYLKTLLLLVKAMHIALLWWNTHRNSTRPTDPKLNELVQWIRDRFNESLERAEYVRVRLAEANAQLGEPQGESAGPAVVAEKLIFDRALEMLRNAAVNELVKVDLKGCELAYLTLIWMLEALLDEDPNARRLDDEDKAMIDKFVVSIGNRLTVLRRKIEGEKRSSTMLISPVDASAAE